MDFHSDDTTISGFIGGQALYYLRRQFTRVWILGVRDVEDGEMENIHIAGNCQIVSDTSTIIRQDWETLHVHVDGDVLDPTINPKVDYPVPGGMSLKTLAYHLRNLPGMINSSSFSNVRDKQLAREVRGLLVNNWRALRYWI